jgi:ribosomal protein S27AE
MQVQWTSKIHRVTPITRRHRPIEDTNDIVLARRVHRHGLGAAARFANRLDNLRDLLRRSAGDEKVIALGREAPAQCGAGAVLGTHADNEASGRAHANHRFPTLAISPASSPVSCISRTMSQPPTKLPST